MPTAPQTSAPQQAQTAKQARSAAIVASLLPGLEAEADRSARDIADDTEQGNSLDQIAGLRPVPRLQSPTVHTLVSVSGPKPDGLQAAGVQRSGWLVASVAALCATVSWALGPLAAGLAMSDELAIAGALGAALLAGLASPLLFAGILRGRGHRGWKPTVGVLIFAALGLAAAWAVRLAAPTVLALGPELVAADPAGAWLMVQQQVQGSFHELLSPHLLALWVSEVGLVVLTVMVSARSLRRPSEA